MSPVEKKNGRKTTIPPASSHGHNGVTLPETAHLLLPLQHETLEVPQHAVRGDFGHVLERVRPRPLTSEVEIRPLNLPPGHDHPADRTGSYFGRERRGKLRRGHILLPPS